MVWELACVRKKGGRGVLIKGKVGHDGMGWDKIGYNVM